MNKEYLGDAVYVEFDGYSFVLTVEDGRQVLETIVLEPDVFNMLVLYVERQRLIQQTSALRGHPDLDGHPKNCLCDTCANTKGTYAYEQLAQARAEHVRQLRQRQQKGGTD